MFEVFVSKNNLTGYNKGEKSKLSYKITSYLDVYSYCMKYESIGKIKSQIKEMEKQKKQVCTY